MKASIVTVNKPMQGWVSLQLREIWDYRELFYFLVWRDIKVRYKQTVLGVSWAIIQPFFTMVVFSLFFGELARIPSDGIPYPIFSYTALLPWTLFSTAVSQSTASLVSGSGLIKKVYFPRLILPIASSITGLVDFMVAFVVLVILMIVYHITPTANIVWLPFLVLLTLATSLGIGFWLSALNIRFRDVGHAVPFLLRIGMFLTPVIYPTSMVSEPWRVIYSLNPMAGVIEGFRWALLDTGNTPVLQVLAALRKFHVGGALVEPSSGPGPMLLLAVGMAIVLFVSGAFYFRRMEKSFADVV